MIAQCVPAIWLHEFSGRGTIGFATQSKIQVILTLAYLGVTVAYLPRVVILFGKCPPRTFTTATERMCEFTINDICGAAPSSNSISRLRHAPPRRKAIPPTGPLSPGPWNPPPPWPSRKQQAAPQCEGCTGFPGRHNRHANRSSQPVL